MATGIHAMASGLLSQAGAQATNNLAFSARKRKARTFTLDGRERLPFETDSPAYLLPTSDFFSSQAPDISAFKQQLPPRDPKQSRLEYIHQIRNYIGINRPKKKRDFGLDKTNMSDFFTDEAQPQAPTPPRLDPISPPNDSTGKKQSWIDAAIARRSSELSKEGPDSAGGGARRLSEDLSKHSAGPSGAGPSGAGLNVPSSGGGAGTGPSGAGLSAPSPEASAGSAGVGAGGTGKASIGVGAGPSDGKRLSGVEAGRRARESSHKQGAVTPGSSAGQATLVDHEEQEQRSMHETPGGASMQEDGGEGEGAHEDVIREADACVGSILEQLEGSGFGKYNRGGLATASPSPAGSVQRGAAGPVGLNAAGVGDAGDEHEEEEEQEEEEQQTSGKAVKSKGNGKAKGKGQEPEVAKTGKAGKAGKAAKAGKGGKGGKGGEASGSVKEPSQGSRRSTRNGKEASGNEAEPSDARANQGVEENDDVAGADVDADVGADMGANDEMGGSSGNDVEMDIDGPEEDAPPEVAPARGAKRKAERAAPAHPLRLESEEAANAGSKRRKQANRTSLGGFGTVLDNGIRRSTRVRLRPLQYWRNEHVIYGRPHHSLPTIVQVELKAPLPEWPMMRRERRVNADVLPLTHSNFPY